LYSNKFGDGKGEILVVLPSNYSCKFPLKLAETFTALLLQSICGVKGNPDKHIHQGKVKEKRRAIPRKLPAKQ
jgi:hypothetical protein